MNAMINPDLAQLRQQVEAQAREVAELRGNMQQMDKFVSATNRQSTLQIAAIVISLCLTIAGGLYFQTNAINRNIEQLEKRMERVERNLDELNKELRAQRQAK